MAKSKRIIMKELEYNKNIIKDLGLTEMQVLNIVSRWYTNGMMPDIIQNGNGCELDEIADDLFFDKFDEEKLIRDIIWDINNPYKPLK
tara:strand:+ start:653 stop:916 length:264 start_codon:yes stop_codon:yes gene_type:complete